MIYVPVLQKAKILRRYKRFLADVVMPDGQEITVHCPNTGSMKNCVVAGSNCWLFKSNNPKRKYAFTWQLATTSTGHLACINTHAANKLVGDALASGLIPELGVYQNVQPEVKYGQGSRIDFLLSDEHGARCYLEVKSVTLLDGEQGFFPDAVSVRGQKHLRELIAVAASGDRAVLLFCVMHTGISSVAAAEHIDPTYAKLLEQAKKAGVEVIAYNVNLSPEELTWGHKLPVL